MMNIDHLRASLNLQEVGQEMYQLMERLYPICRSITGNGVRETLNIIKELYPAGSS